MSDTGAATGQDAGSNQGQAPNQQQGANGGTAGTNDGNNGTNDPNGGTPPEGGTKDDLPGDPSWPAEARQALKAARDEAARRRVENRDLSTKVTEYERSQMTKEEAAEQARKDAEARAEKAEKALQWRDAQAAITASATAAKVTNPALVADLIREDQVQYDDQGKPTNIDALVADVVKRYPDITKTPGGFDGGAGSGSGGTPKTGSMNDIIRLGARR